MGRPSLAAIRREQLLDAVEAIILEQGVDRTTISLVAERAGVQPSLVHHYLGTRDEMMAAAVQRALERVEVIVFDALTKAPKTDPVGAQLKVLFGGKLNAPEINQFIDQLIGASYLDPQIRDAVKAMYARFASILRDSINAEYPGASKTERAIVASAVLALAHASATFTSLGFDPKQARRNHEAAQLLIAGLAKQ